MGEHVVTSDSTSDSKLKVTYRGESLDERTRRPSTQPSRQPLHSHYPSACPDSGRLLPARMHSSSLSAVAISVLACLTTANILTILLSPWKPPKTHHNARQYTYVGEDFPEWLPLPSANPVAMVVENPARYSISGLDAREDWAANTPKGYSYVRLGPEHRSFALSMFHELHCLRLMRSALAGDHTSATREHYAHCLVYLRQLVLCNPDLTLEPPDVMQHDYEVKQDGSVHVCQDWRQVYDAMAANWKEWRVVRQMGFHLKTDGAADA